MHPQLRLSIVRRADAEAFTGKEPATIVDATSSAPREESLREPGRDAVFGGTRTFGRCPANRAKAARKSYGWARDTRVQRPCR